MSLYVWVCIVYVTYTPPKKTSNKFSVFRQNQNFLYTAEHFDKQFVCMCVQFNVLLQTFLCLIEIDSDHFSTVQRSKILLWQKKKRREREKILCVNLLYSFSLIYINNNDHNDNCNNEKFVPLCFFNTFIVVFFFCVHSLSLTHSVGVCFFPCMWTFIASSSF